MLKKTVTYANVDGDQVSKDLYFNISANQLVEKEALSNQTYSEKLKAIASSDKLSDIYPTVMEFIQDGYGVRTSDGDFVKDPTGDDWEKFKSSLAYEALMDELLMNSENNGNRLAEFINGMLPPSLRSKMQEQTAVPGFRPGVTPTRPNPPVAGEQPASRRDALAAESEATAPAQPVYAEPVVTEPDVPQYRENLPENGGSTTVAEPPAVDYSQAAEPSVIVQTSAPRTPELPGQAPQQ